MELEIGIASLVFPFAGSACSALITLPLYSLCSLRSHSVSVSRMLCSLRSHSKPLTPQAKKFVESVPQTLKENVPKDEAEKLQKKLQELGATVSMA